ncbi:MAG TPA: ATP synthase F1 subunit delta [Polyangia bacterium]|nr:ATP synthase F1 subunit delta [Polyangia bacterium]
MITGSLARRYAKALLALGIQQQTYDALGKELDRTAETFARSPELRVALENPVFPFEKRRLVLEDVARRLALSKTVRNFVMLLLDKGRIGALPDIARAHRTLVDEHAGRVRATVTTVRPLDPVLESRLKSALERQSGKTVLLDKREDPTIVGGLITQLGDIVYDGSVRTQLLQLREQLLSE